MRYHSGTHGSKSQLQEIVANAQQVQSKRRIVRILNATDYVERTELWVKKLDQHISNFLASANYWYMSADSHRSYSLKE